MYLIEDEDYLDFSKATKTTTLFPNKPNRSQPFLNPNWNSNFFALFLTWKRLIWLSELKQKTNKN
jgi:hypothetical protein